MFALIGVDGNDDDDNDDDDYGDGGGGEEKFCDDFAYNPTLFMIYRRHVFVSQG